MPAAAARWCPCCTRRDNLAQPGRRCFVTRTPATSQAISRRSSATSPRRCFDVFEPDDCRRLLGIARTALEARVRREIERAPEIGGVLATPRGAFVSIHHGDDLRGCLGRLEADWAIARVVAHLGRAVADSDPRFP